MSEELLALQNEIIAQQEEALRVSNELIGAYAELVKLMEKKNGLVEDG